MKSGNASVKTLTSCVSAETVQNGGGPLTSSNCLLTSRGAGGAVWWSADCDGDKGDGPDSGPSAGTCVLREELFVYPRVYSVGGEGESGQIGLRGLIRVLCALGLILLL